MRQEQHGQEGGYAVVVTNPSRRDLNLTRHSNLSREDAEELAAVYLALGYAQALLSVTSEEQEAAA